MSKNNSKKGANPTPVQNKTAARSEKKPKKKVVIIAAVSIAAFLILFVSGLFAVINNSRQFDYMNEDLSKYITLSENDYKGISLDFEFDGVENGDVQRKINALLCKNKNKTPLYDGANVINMPITLGDVVKIYYRGYTVDEDGNEVEVENSSNLFDKVYELEIGSGSFIPGFEESLLGIIPKEYPREITKITQGKVMANDVIYLSYEAIYPDGSVDSVSAERIDLSSKNVDKKYGSGFKNFFVGGKSPEGAALNAKTIGETISEQKVFNLSEGGSAVYYNMKVEYAIREAEAPLTIDARFPSTYFEESLRGVDVKFDVYIQSVVFYDTPEYNEEFITKTLKIKESDLAKYEGDSILEKHKAMIYEELEREETKNRRSVYETEIWKQLHEKVKVKKLPESEVNIYYLSEYNQMYSLYASYQQSYESVDAFARAYYKLSANGDWKGHITSLAEEIVTEKIIFYYILKSESLIPEGEAYDEKYNEVFGESLEYYKDIYKAELDKCKTDEEYNKKLEEIKSEMVEYYGENYFRESVYYLSVVDKLVEWTEQNAKK